MKHFSTILIPVDFTSNTAAAVVKATQLCNADSGTIHLLSVNNEPEPYFGKYAKVKEREITLKLNRWRAEIQQMLPSATTVSHVMKGNIEKAIIEVARELSTDLVIICKSSQHSWLPFLKTVEPSRIAESAGCPVLAIKPAAATAPIKKVVLPVGNTLPKKKLDMLMTLGAKTSLHVHLISIASEKETTDAYAAALTDTYRWLKKHPNFLVEYHVLKGGNKAKSTLDYALKIDADLVLVTPESETKMNYWINKFITDDIVAASKLHVLQVEADK